jgi:formamidopyrimidine-DNA glycosylase
MPELPEVETMRRGILPIVGAAVTDVRRTTCLHKPLTLAPDLSVFRRRTAGAEITGIQRRGKRLLIWLDGAKAIVLEPRMTGLVLLRDPPSVEHLRLRFELAGTAERQLWYWDRRGLGRVQLLGQRQLQQQLGPERLGPDALDVDGALLRARLGSSRRSIKVGLLDQRAVAGIGNLYACEILHVARIDPRAHCHRLTRGQWQRLADATSQVLQEAIHYEGSTLSDGTYRTALSRPGQYQNHHRVYGQAGKPCPLCQRSVIQRIVQAQRSTFFCPACQKRQA